MKFIKDLLSENSDVSMMRLMCLIVCCTACYIAITKRADELGIISILLTTAFGSKIAQKGIEVKAQTDKKEDSNVNSR